MSSPSQKPTVWFRTDCHEKIGYGHFSRCLNLAEVFYEKGYLITFIGRGFPQNQIPKVYRTIHQSNTSDDLMTNDPNTWLRTTIEADAQECIEHMNQYESKNIYNTTIPLIDFMIIDHYAIDIKWERIIKPYVGKIVVIDDLCRMHQCDYYIDYTLRPMAKPNIPIPIPIPDYALALMGPDYCLLNKVFGCENLTDVRTYNINSNVTTVISSLLINFGGSDLQHQTMKVLDAIMNNTSQLPEFKQIYIVCGSLYHDINELHKKTNNMSNVKILQNLSQLEMIKLTCSVDLCIGGAGVTAYERCCLGIPSIVISMSDNQIDNAVNLSNCGAIYYLGKNDEWTKEQLIQALVKCNTDEKYLNSLKQKGQNIVDGNGCQRTVDTIISTLQ